MRWTPEAFDDFESIRDFIAEDSVAAAVRQCERISESIDQLSRFAESGRKSRTKGIRQLFVPRTPYIIFYRIHSNTIELIRIMHGAQRIPKKLGRT